MGEAGILGEDDRVELIDGEILAMTPIGPRHAHCVRRLIALLTSRVATSAIVDVQNPLVLGEHSEPQPDVVLLRPRPDFYRHSHPGPQDVLLVIEVADSSSDYDRTVKVPQYARAGIWEVWLIDLAARVVEVYRGPSGGEYGEHLAVGPGSSLQLPGVVDRRIAIDDIL
jgi:Uma2 family endonuclease